MESTLSKMDTAVGDTPYNDHDKKQRDSMSNKQWVLMLFEKYDRSFLICLTFSYFNQGFKVFMDLSIMDMFKHYLFLEPSEA